MKTSGTTFSNGYQPSAFGCQLDVLLQDVFTLFWKGNFMPIVNISDELYERASGLAIKKDRSVDEMVDLLATLFLDRMEQEQDEFTPEALAELHVSFERTNAQIAAGTLHSEQDIDTAIQELYNRYAGKRL